MASIKTTIKVNSREITFFLGNKNTLEDELQKYTKIKEDILFGLNERYIAGNPKQNDKVSSIRRSGEVRKRKWIKKLPERENFITTIDVN